ncbi:MAG TPA: hypothetical protein VGI10_29790 [Polyangiaceae bacterium]|jgi:hypothetical protein
MVTPRFDPSYVLEFDLARGQVKVRDAGERLVVPVDALLALCQGAGSEAVRDFGRRIGTEAGRAALERLGDGAAAPIDAVVEHLGGELSLMGVGALGVERWGVALVVTFQHSPLGAAGENLLAGLIEGALQRAFARDVVAAPLARDADQLRFLVTSRRGADKVRDLLASGMAWGDVLTRLVTASGGGA